MQNGTAHADVNPMVNAGNDSVNVVNKDSGASGSTGASSTSTGASSASSVVLTGNTTNSMTPSQVSGSPVEGATKQVNDAASEPGSTVPAGQVSAGADKTNAPVPNRQTSVAGGNPGNEHLSDNLSLSVNQNSNFNFSSLLASKVSLTSPNNAVNGGFDEATWGKLDVNAWQGRVQGDYYELTDYTGDANHVIVPNEADFEKAGISTSGKQVGVTSDLMHRIFGDKTTAQDATVAFSKTDNKMVKAIDSNWSNTWNPYENFPMSANSGSLSKFDGTNLDVSNVTNMSYMFSVNQISDLSSLANWNVANVTNMSYMFSVNQISDLSSLANWNTGNVTDMSRMFTSNQISDLGPLANWKVDNARDMSQMFGNNQISDLSPLASWNVNNVTNMMGMFGNNQISDLSPLADWNVNNVDYMSSMFDDNSSVITQAKRVINFVYPAGYTGKKQDSVTQTVDLPQKVSITLTTKDSKPSNNVLDWVTKKETPETPAPVYFKDYTVPEIKGLLEPDQTVVASQQADITKPINVTVTYKLVESNTNDAFALDSKNGLHEHANVNDNGGYDTDFWGTLDVSKFTTVKNGDDLEITGYNGDASKVIIPNIADFELNNLDQGAKQVTIISGVMSQLAKNATRIGLSKTGNQKVVASDAFWSNVFGGVTYEPNTISNAYGGMWVYNPNLTVMDLHNLDTTNIIDMIAMFNGGRNLKVVGDLSQWNVANVVYMSDMFQGASGLTNIGNLDNWDTSNVTNMARMFYNATNLTNIGDLSKWQTGNVTDMSYMFTNTTSLTNIGDLSKWDTSNVTTMRMMFNNAKALRHLNISNWNLTNLANKDSMQYMFAEDPNLTVIANNLELPTWYQNEINDADYFWSNHMAVITNVPELIKSTGDIDSLKIDDKDASRSIFYDSKGSSDAIQVLKDANQAYIKQYQNDHPGYTLNLAADVDQTDPIALANANFVSVPREVQFTIAYYDLTGKLVDSTTSTHKVGETVAISPVAPVNYVLVNGQSSTDRLMQWGLNEADFLVEPKVTTATQTKTVTRTIKVQTPDGQTHNVVQTVTFTRNSYLNEVTKQTTYSPWPFGGQYQFSGYQPKPIDGYTADVIPALSVTPDSLDTTVNVVYHKISAAYSVDYQLANGTVVKNVSVTPERNGTIHLTAPQGYRLLTSVTDVQVGPSSQKLAVLVAPAEQTYTVYDGLPSGVTEPLIKTVTRTVKITMPNGHIRTVKQSVKFERTATVNSAGQVTYGNWQAIGRAQFNKVFVPKRRGYHLVITDASGKALTAVEKVNTVTAAMDDAVVNVKYVKD